MFALRLFPVRRNILTNVSGSFVKNWAEITFRALFSNFFVLIFVRSQRFVGENRWGSDIFPLNEWSTNKKVYNVWHLFQELGVPVDCIQAVHTTLAQCGWIISFSLPHAFCGTVTTIPCVYCVHFCEAFPSACCRFRSEIIVLQQSIWPFNNIASSTGPHLPLCWMLERTKDWCRICIGSSTFELHFVHITAFRYISHPSFMASPLPQLIHGATFHQFIYISSAEFRRIHRAISFPPSYVSSDELLIRWASSHPLVYISFLWPVSRPQN